MLHFKVEFAIAASPPPAKSKANSKPIDTPLQPSLIPPEPMQTQSRATIEHLAEKVRATRIGPNETIAIVAMHERLKQWSPVGRKTNEVEEIPGKPSEVDQDKLVYRFDDGDQAYEWTMEKANDSITSISIILHE